MSKYAIIYDYDNGYSAEYNIRSEFVGSWDDLQDELKAMKSCGCYNIDAACIDDCEW